MSTFDPCGTRTLGGDDIIRRIAVELGVDDETLRIAFIHAIMQITNQ